MPGVLVAHAFSPTGTASVMATLVSRADDSSPAAKARNSVGIGIVSFLAAIAAAAIVFAVQFLLFVLLRNRLARILCVL